MSMQIIIKRTTTHRHLYLPKDYSGSLTTSIYTEWTDVAFVRTQLEDEFISSELLHRQPIVVVLAETNPLSRSVSLSIADIADQPIVGYPKHARPILHEALWSGFRKIGAQPNIVCEIIDKSTLLQFVAQDRKGVV